MSRRSKKRNHNNISTGTTSNNITTSIEALDAAVLERDFTYQRPVNKNRVRKIVKEFDPDLVNILKVSYRDGHYYVFDGSHTLDALRIVNAREHFPVICKLYRGLDQKGEARLFALQNGLSSRVGTPYKLRALETADDQETVKFLEATRSTGFDIAPGERSSRKNTIAAVTKANAVYKKLGEEVYKDMLTLIRETWNGESWSVTQNMLSGMAIFFKTYGERFSRKRFLKKLAPASQVTVQREASKHPNVDVGYQYAYAIASIYNSGGAKGTLKLNYLTIDMVESEDRNR